MAKILLNESIDYHSILKRHGFIYKGENVFDDSTIEMYHHPKHKIDIEVHDDDIGKHVLIPYKIQGQKDSFIKTPEELDKHLKSRPDLYR